MNKVILMGRLTKEVEVSYSKGDKPVAIARYALAVRRQFAKQGEKDVDFFNVVVFGKAAEFAEKYFRKGQQVAVTGRLQQNIWEDEGKVKHQTIDVVAEEQHFAESKKENNQYNYEQQVNKSTSVQQNAFTTQAQDADDLPF